jgi:hypothetical protein
MHFCILRAICVKVSDHLVINKYLDFFKVLGSDQPYGVVWFVVFAYLFQRHNPRYAGRTVGDSCRSNPKIIMGDNLRVEIQTEIDI